VTLSSLASGGLRVCARLREFLCLRGAAAKRRAQRPGANQHAKRKGKHGERRRKNS